MVTDPTDSAVDPELYEDDPSQPTGWSRRKTLKAAGAAGVATVGFFWLRGMGNPQRAGFVDRTEAGAPGASFKDWERRTVAAIQDRLLPADDGAPGARDANTEGYLDGLMATPFLSKYSKQLIRWGIKEVHRRARLQGAGEFAKLTAAQQDEILKDMESRGGGVRWLAKMLSYTLEGFFGDPVHGANPEAVAWKWAQHRPGFPRPTTPNWRPEGR